MKREFAQLMKDAAKLVESTRYSLGTSSFLDAFIDDWAYQQSKLYPPRSNVLGDLRPISMKLSYVMSEAIREHPFSDAFGVLLSSFGFHKQGTNFYPTPPEVSRLISLISCSGMPKSYYEPCSGTGINALIWIDNFIEKHGADALKDVTITLEDIDPLMVKSSFIQLINYFDVINVSPKSLSIECIDVLSRKPKNILYYATLN